MSVALDIARTYRAPRQIVRRRAAAPASEPRALVILMLGCALMFVAALPGLRRAAFMDPSIPYESRLSGALLAWIFVMPLVFYTISFLVRGLAQLLGGRASGYEARIAMFWALLAASPAWLLSGLVAGLIGEGPAQYITGSIAALAFLVFWGAGVWEVECGTKNRS